MKDHDVSEDFSGASDLGRGDAECAESRIRMVACEPAESVTMVTHVYHYDPEPDLFEPKHIEEKGVFAVTGPDGNAGYFRDKPARYLVVELDPETGQFVPVMKRRRPVLLWLCREERDVR